MFKYSILFYFQFLVYILALEFMCVEDDKVLEEMEIVTEFRLR